MIMPEKLNDRKERQDFQKNFSDTCKRWSVEKNLGKRILECSEILEGEKLKEYFEIVGRLVVKADLNRRPDKETRKGYPSDGRQVSLIYLKEALEPKPFNWITLCYAPRDKRIYDFLLDYKSVLEEPRADDKKTINTLLQKLGIRAKPRDI